MVGFLHFWKIFSQFFIAIFKPQNCDLQPSMIIKLVHWCSVLVFLVVTSWQSRLKLKTLIKFVTAIRLTLETESLRCHSKLILIFHCRKHRNTFVVVAQEGRSQLEWKILRPDLAARRPAIQHSQQPAERQLLQLMNVNAAAIVIFQSSLLVTFSSHLKLSF